MQTNLFARPDDRELLRSSLRTLSGRFRSAVLFAGLANQEQLRLTDFLGNTTSSLNQLLIVPGAGLGGRVFREARPYVVPDYCASEGITHEYDVAVRREQLASVAAVPVVVRGRSRAVIYMARRENVPLGENAMCEAVAAAAVVAEELRVRDEVDRRVAIIDTARATPSAVPDQGWLENVREAHAELRSLARTVPDPDLARQLAAAGGHSGTVRLTRRELDVLAQVALGCSYQEAGDRLALKAVTVKSYMQNAMCKLTVRNRLEAVSAARRLRLIP